MDTECQRWIDLCDRKAMGEALLDVDAAWIVKHAQSCEDCGREAAFYDDLRSSLGSPERLVQCGSGPQVLPRRRRVGATIGLAAAAGMAITLGGLHLLRPAPTVSKTQPAPTAAVIFASAGTSYGDRAIGAGAALDGDEMFSTADGQACAAIAGSITVCLDAHSAARVKLASPQQIVVRLEKGRLLARLDKQPNGREFLVRAPRAEVRAAGTRFLVDARQPERTVVRLHEGKVAVRAVNQLRSDLIAPAQASVTETIWLENMAPAAAAEDRVLDQLSTLPRDGKGARVTITSTPPSAEVVLGGVPLGRTPVSTIVAKGTGIHLSLDGYEPIHDWLDIAEGGSTERAFTLAALPAQVDEPPTHRVHHVAGKGDPGEMLAKAQAMRAQGHYQECVRLYRMLGARFPGSDEAKVSLVALGELELTEFHKPSVALAAFSAYVRVGGPLVREARYGKIRALRALHRDLEADSEVAAFLTDYPTSMQAATLRQRPHGR